MSEKAKVKYTGKGRKEICVGNHVGVFEKKKHYSVDPAFAAHLIGREDFEAVKITQQPASSQEEGEE